MRLESAYDENVITCPIAYREVRIIPQAVSVRYGLAVGAQCVPLVLAMMYILGSSSFAPIH